MAAGMAFYALLALVPLLLGFLAVLGVVLRSPQAQQGFLELVTSHLPVPDSAELVQLVQRNLEGVVRLRGALALGAVFGFIGTGGMLFAAIGRSVNRAWGIYQDRPSYLGQPLRWGLALAVGGVLLVTTWANIVVELLVQGVPDLPGQRVLVVSGEVALWVVPGTASFLVFLLIYRFVPYGKTYWRYVWPGALVAALLVEVGKELFVWYLENLAVYNRVYGQLYSAIALLSWVYLSALILVLGAHISARWQELRTGGPSP
jgi:membrane protein